MSSDEKVISFSQINQCVGRLTEQRQWVKIKVNPQPSCHFRYFESFWEWVFESFREFSRVFESFWEFSRVFTFCLTRTRVLWQWPCLFYLCVIEFLHELTKSSSRISVQKLEDRLSRAPLEVTDHINNCGGIDFFLQRWERENNTFFYINFLKIFFLSLFRSEIEVSLLVK